MRLHKRNFFRAKVRGRLSVPDLRTQEEIRATTSRLPRAGVMTITVNTKDLLENDKTPSTDGTLEESQ